MKLVLNIFGVLFSLVGLVWILQGVNVLQGSMMSGHIQYSFLGVGALVIGVVMLFFANRRPKVGV